VEPSHRRTRRHDYVRRPRRLDPHQERRSNTYSGPSQPIAYSYVLTNTGNVAINSIVLNDDKAGAANCPSTSLAVGASMTCTANYNTTEADVTAGSVTNTANRKRVPTSGTLADVDGASDDHIRRVACVDAYENRITRRRTPPRGRRSTTAIS